MNIEQLKPTPLTRGSRSRPTISILSESKMAINAAGLALLGIDKNRGGYVGFSRDTETNDFYVTLLGEKDADAFSVQAQGKITDLLFPSKLCVRFRITPEAKSKKVYISAMPVKLGKVQGYKILDE